MRFRHLAGCSLAAAAAAVIGACHRDGNGPTSSSGNFDLSSLQSCPAGTALFTTIPIAPAQVMGWVPLGNMAPPAHTFPTDHQYIYIKGFGSTAAAPVVLLSPGDVTIIGAKRTRYSAGSVTEDYSIFFAPCAQVNGEFGHVRTIDAALLARLGAFDQNCNTYSPNPGLNVTQCSTKGTKVVARAGDMIGTTAGLDLWLRDSRVPAITFANPARWQANPDGLDYFHVVPMSDYFAEPVRTTVRGMLGSYDGAYQRTQPPIGGTIASDIAGTLQGHWFNPTKPTYPEYEHMAIAPDNVYPSRIDVSMGLAQPGFLSNLYYITPASSGSVNRHPAQVTPSTQILCYEFQNQYGVALLQLSDAATLRFEGRNGAGRTCASEQPWAFSAAAVTFRR